MIEYNAQEIEEKWQVKWKENKVFNTSGFLDNSTFYLKDLGRILNKINLKNLNFI